MGDVVALARLLDGLHEMPRHSYELAARFFLGGAVGLLGATDGFVLLARRLPRRPAGILEQWHPVHLVYHRDDPERDRVVGEFVASGEAGRDPRTLALAAGAGRDRAHLRSSLVPDAEWVESPSFHLEQRLGRGDALHAAAPLDADTEVYAGVYRPTGAAPFDDADRDMLLALIVGARASLRRAARALGVLEPDVTLTPRQRGVLDLLLTGASEKEIATHLGVGPGTIHHHVVAIYRVFRVRSRPELMALWLGHHTATLS